jgi:hypothetical protein
MKELLIKLYIIINKSNKQELGYLHVGQFLARRKNGSTIKKC